MAELADAADSKAYRVAISEPYYSILLVRYSEGVTMRVPLYAPRVNKSLSPATSKIRFRKGGALQKHIVARITAYLYRASNLHTDATRQNRLQRRCCPVLFPGELFRQDAHDLRVNLIAGGNHVFAYRFFERQRRRAAMFRKLKRGNPDVCVDDDDHPFDRTLRRGFSARTSLMSRGTSASV